MYEDVRLKGVQWTRVSRREPGSSAAAGAKHTLLLPAPGYGTQGAHSDPGCLEPPSVIAFHTAPAMLSTTHTHTHTRPMLSVCV